MPKLTDSAVKIIVSGYVQGVGFRWFVCREAQALGLNGYVRNLSSGQVEVVATGEKGLIDDLVKILRAGPRYASISDVQLQEIDIKEEFDDFGIR